MTVRYRGARAPLRVVCSALLLLATVAVLCGGAAVAGPGTGTPDGALGAALAPDAAPKADEIVLGAFVNDIQELDFRTHS